MEVIQAIANFLTQAAPYLMLGLFVSGLIHQLIPMSWIEKALGKKKTFSFVTAAFVGIPLPLCSCSVIPTAVTLRKKGASKAATSSFLIATPESGVDSIAMTYGLMDLPMTLIRPIAAFTSAFVSGGLVSMFANEDEPIEQSSGGCCKKSKVEPAKGPVQLLKNALKYGYGNLLRDISFWLTIGIVSGGLISWLVPPEAFTQVDPAVQKLLIIGAGLPLYICASASTPIALSLMMKGLSPGAALIFLLVGPATNLSSILVLQKALGKKVIAFNLMAIVSTAVAFGFLVDYLYLSYDWPLDFTQGHHHGHEHGPSTVTIALTAIFSVLLLKALYDEEIAPKLRKSKE